jgi:hypothetical protein
MEKSLSSWHYRMKANEAILPHPTLVRMNPNLLRVLPVFLIVALHPRATVGQPSRPFRVEEATISEIHAAMRAKRLTCRQLVSKYLARIEAYDKKGPAINALVTVNPQAPPSRVRSTDFRNVG